MKKIKSVAVAVTIVLIIIGTAVGMADNLYFYATGKSFTFGPVMKLMAYMWG